MKEAMNMLHYEFMRIAFLVAILLGIAIPLVGSTTIYKRLSASGDALAHSSLAGVAIGLAAGINPLLISIIACVVSFLLIELIRKRFSKFNELAVSIVLSASIAVAGIVSKYASGGNLESYLFGSILMVDDIELYLVIGITAISIIFYLFFYRQIFAYLYNEDEAKVQGIKVGWINFFQSLLVSLVIAISAKTIGSLVVSSLIAIPLATSLQAKLSYKKTLILSIIVSLISMIGGIIISYYLEWRAGASIALVSIALLIFFLLFRLIYDAIKKKRNSKSI